MSAVLSLVSLHRRALVLRPLRLRHAASLVAAAAPVSRTVGRDRSLVAEGSAGVEGRVLAHRQVLARPGGDPRPRRATSRAGLGDQAAVAYALRHVADHPHVAAQLILVATLAVGLHLTAVDAKVDVTGATDLAVVSGVGVYHLDELGVAGVETVHQARPQERPGGIQADYPARSDLCRWFFSRYL